MGWDVLVDCVENYSGERVDSQAERWKLSCLFFQVDVL